MIKILLNNDNVSKILFSKGNSKMLTSLIYLKKSSSNPSVKKPLVSSKSNIDNPHTI